MKQDHITAGAGTLLSGDAISTVLAYYQHVEPTVATAESTLILGLLGGVAAFIQWWMNRRNPPAPQPQS